MNRLPSDRRFTWNMKTYFLWKIKKNISKCRLLQLYSLSINSDMFTRSNLGTILQNIVIMWRHYSGDLSIGNLQKRIYCIGIKQRFHPNFNYGITPDKALFSQKSIDISYFLGKTHMGTHQKCLALQMSTHNICFHPEIRNILCGYPLLSAAMLWDWMGQSLPILIAELTR